jgi:hypothetical protein
VADLDEGMLEYQQESVAENRPGEEGDERANEYHLRGLPTIFPLGSGWYGIKSKVRHAYTPVSEAT